GFVFFVTLWCSSGATPRAFHKLEEALHGGRQMLLPEMGHVERAPDRETGDVQDDQALLTKLPFDREPGEDPDPESRSRGPLHRFGAPQLHRGRMQVFAGEPGVPQAARGGVGLAAEDALARQVVRLEVSLP